MANFTNIPTGLKIQSQLPLDQKEWVINEATLANLGSGDNLAFTYHDQLEVLCLEEKTIYRWREVQVGEENTGLLTSDFTYPSSLPEIFGIDYSDKVYNFFQVDYITAENIADYVTDNSILYTMDNTSTGIGEAAIYKESLTPAPGNTEFVLRSLRSTDESVTITEETNSINFSINEDQGFLENGTTTTITGVGSNADPYRVEVANLQKLISSFPYTLTNADDKYTLFVNNAIANVVINVPDSLVNNFSCALIQKGTGTVDVVATGTATVNEPSGLDPQIKGQYHWALIEKELTTDVYYLGGSLKTT